MKGCHEVLVYRALSNDRLNCPQQHFFSSYCFFLSQGILACISFFFHTITEIATQHMKTLEDRSQDMQLLTDGHCWIRSMHYPTKPEVEICFLQILCVSAFRHLTIPLQPSADVVAIKSQDRLHLLSSLSFTSKLTQPDSHL